MGTLPVVKQTQVRASLERAGFRKVHQTGSHVKLVGRGRTVIVQQHKGRAMPLGTLTWDSRTSGNVGRGVQRVAEGLKEGQKAVARYAILLTPDTESGAYTVTVPALPGCITHGDTIEEALEMAHDAIACYLELPVDAPANEGDRIEVIMATVDVAVPA